MENEAKKPLELYIHVPFCVKKCDYCDFLSGPAGKERQREYFQALEREIAAVPDFSERDERHLVTQVNGKPTAQLLFYNGLSYTVSQGAVSYLPNPYIEENLAFSFQLEYQAAQYYPDLYRGIYLAGLRYNLHLKPRALLLEAGAQTNTVEEVRNAMEPFADILNRVLKGSDKEG